MMDEELRTIWCGNLNDKVTEELLYELFLQGGPVERVKIPKDRDGKQRKYAFITYKHANSVPYALNLFDGTMLFNRPITISRRKQTELSFNLDHMLQLGQEVLLGNNMPHYKLDTCGMDMTPTSSSQVNEKVTYSYKDERRSRRPHPYHREKFPSSNHHENHSPRYVPSNNRVNEYPRRSYRCDRYNYR